MNVIDRVLDALNLGGPLTRADRPRWAATRTLADVSELTAQWLEGHIDSQPGYYGRVDVDEAPGLTDALITLNRAGLVTDNSQAGYDGPGHDGAHWRQLAAVTGFCDKDTHRRLRDALTGTPFRTQEAPGVVVTWREHTPYTTFGGPLRRAMVTDVYAGCGRDAVEALCDAIQITIYDPTPGGNELWPALRRALPEVTR